MTGLNQKIERMIGQLDILIETARAMEKKYEDLLAGTHPNYQDSARNLLHYKALRQFDIRSLQKQLGYLGLSRLAKSEHHVMASLLTARSMLRGFLKPKRLKKKRSGLSIKRGYKLLNSHSKNLLGNRSKGRRPRIMVTIPSEASTDFDLVNHMVEAGMNIARINCAHDNPEVWKQMISNIQLASEKHQRRIKISMDLAGPKIRTGAIAPGPRVIKLRTSKNVLGEVLKPATIWLSPGPPEDTSLIHLPVSDDQYKDLKAGHSLIFRDSRGKKRKLLITAAEKKGCIAECWQTAYVISGTALTLKHKPEAPPLIIRTLPALEQSILLHPGQLLRIHMTSEPGENAVVDKDGKIETEAHISCTSHEVFEQVKVGEKVRFDDGKLSGIIKQTADDAFVVKINRTAPGGSKLRADKGMNFPESNLQIRGLTKADLLNLPFVAENADIVNMSFVNSSEDVEELLAALRERNALDKVGIIMKIETRTGFDNLMDILLAAMKAPSVGVMIARGDLAVETGWDQIGMIQEEIQWICQAAHVPDIWATQVLENLAKKGLPSRAEITDVTMGQRAEGVMLNKGPHIIQAIRLLDTILRNMSGYQEKKAGLTPPAMSGIKT